MKAVRIFRYVIFLTLVFLISTKSYGSERAVLSIIPQPVKIHLSGGNFKITSETVIIVDNNTSEEGKYLAELLSLVTGFNLKTKQASQQKPGNNCIKLIISPEETYLGEEGYKLSVQSDGVVIEAPKLAGIFYGIQTLQQLLPLEIETHKPLNDNIICSIPCVEIEDKPRFKWRGLMIDCSRTFWSKEYIKRYISLLSRYKMNRLHLHLTDDQGWRIEIKKHPKLTEVGSKFAKKYNEPPEREGYYSQDDIREIISYGAKHNVTIVPEIEMPGHSTAALAVYPELSCTGGPFEIYPFFKGPHVTKDVLCAGNEKTFKFLEEVITEVAELFPCEFIHIGGDEVPKDRWSECEKCQSLMKKEGLKDMDELQSYFIKRVEKIVTSKGKRLLGWDEILEGGLAPNASVMSWRGVQGGIMAAESGHNVVMSPTSHCYFDYEYTETSTKKAYSFEPIPDGLSSEKSHFILGAQANFWSHIDRTESKVDKQIFPRLLSIAEVTWSPKEHRDYTDFVARLRVNCKRLEELGVKIYNDPTVWNEK